MIDKKNNTGMDNSGKRNSGNVNSGNFNNCVQCGEEMKNSYGNKEWSAPFCENPECPNYGLLQSRECIKMGNSWRKNL